MGAVQIYPQTDEATRVETIGCEGESGCHGNEDLNRLRPITAHWPGLTVTWQKNNKKKGDWIDYIGWSWKWTIFYRWRHSVQFSLTVHGWNVSRKINFWCHYCAFKTHLWQEENHSTISTNQNVFARNGWHLSGWADQSRNFVKEGQ